VTLKFGTDGIRGHADTELTSDVVFDLGRSAAEVLAPGRFLIGRDTRASGPRIERAFAAGLHAGGRDVELLGVMPTPGVAHLSQVGDCPAAVISASHNPWADNGIKLFLPGGHKLTDDLEERLEDELARRRTDRGEREADEVVGDDRSGLVEQYRDWLVSSMGGLRLDGLRIALDCANGAGSQVAPEVFAELGATVDVAHADPDGKNINEGCGATELADLQQRVAAGSFEIGLALDGDADRVLAVDERAEVVDGDQIMAMCAIDRRDRGILAEDTLVVTVMSNLGLRRGMESAGIRLIETPVGDHHVLAALKQGDLTLGGEQSGHVIFADLATTGDGILTGLQVCALLMRSERSLSDLAGSAMIRYPQVLVNVTVPGGDTGILERLAPDVALEEGRLEGDGRILLRPSGTEPVIRVMVEAPTRMSAEAVAHRLAARVEMVASGE
jgi:phosphoglucosamine mutase